MNEYKDCRNAFIAGIVFTAMLIAFLILNPSDTAPMLLAWIMFVLPALIGSGTYLINERKRK